MCSFECILKDQLHCHHEHSAPVFHQIAVQLIVGYCQGEGPRDTIFGVKYKNIKSFQVKYLAVSQHEFSIRDATYRTN
jgi:hypothetical protein